MGVTVPAPDLTVSVDRPGPADWDDILAILRAANFHRLGGVEMRDFPLADCFVARAQGRVVGVAGYELLDPATAKTSLLAVDPAWRGRGVGTRLQQARIDYLRGRGVRRLYTNCDDERVIAWNRREFGFRTTGRTIAKAHSFGRTDRDRWINLRLDLD